MPIDKPENYSPHCRVTEYAALNPYEEALRSECVALRTENFELRDELRRLHAVLGYLGATYLREHFV